MKINKFLLATSICGALAFSGCVENKDKFADIDLNKYQIDYFIDKNTPIKIEVDETYDLSEFTKDLVGLDLLKLKFVVNNSRYAIVEEMILKGVEIGKTDLYVIYNESTYQPLQIEVVESLDASFTMDWGRLHGKKVWFFGDSVTYGTGVSYNDQERMNNRYSKLLNDYYEFDGKDSDINFAIGGTTMTHEYEGSNILLEYGNSHVFRKTGVSLIAQKQMFLSAIDYVFIAYTHNDQYFQAAIGDDSIPENLDDCKSFKQSYSYAINLIKQKNPNARIVLIAPNYSIYAPNPNYDVGLKYSHYITALEELAVIHNCKFINLWTPTETEIITNKKTLLADSVHLNAEGHQFITEIIKNS